ncbi:MAG TPA: flagellar motor switch protein FliN [Candidatus Gastranaerophilaceae bacterium]|nr:flagellar motor switch protein FliN [Candidatus Gastranaerophilaceae bacterium]HPT41402.1 flagellar motor switch protein FliN [Candidatus Gastranaerophilaceae bacterium]
MPDEEKIEQEDIKQEAPAPEVKEEKEEVVAQPTEEVIVKREPAESTVVDNEDSQIQATDEPVTVRPIKFASFEDINPSQGEVNKNLDILMDIKLQLTVELGRTELPIRKVLELTRGSIIELEKVAGEPVELYANGKLVAHGEVVVIEDNFGLRITSITEPEDRIKGIQ